MAHLPGRPALAVTLLLATALVPAMWHLWVVAYSANSNFYWSMCLLVGGWQAALLVTLARAAIVVDRLADGKPLSAAAAATAN